MHDTGEVCALVARTCKWADTATIKRLLYPTNQHCSAVRNRTDAIATLSRCIAARGSQHCSTPAATEDLLARGKCSVYCLRWPNANVLPHLVTIPAKLQFLAHMIGLLLNHLFCSAARCSQVYDKDHMGHRSSLYGKGLRGGVGAGKKGG